MKTAISVPDELFREVDARARKLGMSRSEFYARAARRYVDQLDSDVLTAAIDAAIDAGAGNTDDEFVHRAAEKTLARNAFDSPR